jgi:hypothetical protein
LHPPEESYFSPLKPVILLNAPTATNRSAISTANGSAILAGVVKSSATNLHTNFILDFLNLERKTNYDSSDGNVVINFKAESILIFAAFCSFLKECSSRFQPDNPKTYHTATMHTDAPEVTPGSLRVSIVTNSLEPLTFNRQKVDFSKVESFDLKYDAFDTKLENGQMVSSNTPRVQSKHLNSC